MATDKPVQSLEIENAPEQAVDSNLEKIDRMLVNEDRAPEARGLQLDSVPNNYWYSWEFIGTFIAIILAKDAGSGGYSLAAPVLSTINKEIGPDPDITWVSLSWTLTQGISTLVVGRLSDVFGRRWIFIIASLLGTIGSIWATQATSVKQLIGATVLLGMAGGVQISYFWIISEIVPMKWRFAANSLIYVFSFTSWIGPKISYEFSTRTEVGWRGSYYLLVALNGLSTLCWWAFYHPPTFRMLHRRQALFQVIRDFDWFGLLLYSASFTSFLIGLNWGGKRYPWQSAEVIATLVSGIGGLAIFIAYEILLPRYTKKITPFVEMHFFTNVPLIAITGMTCVAGSSYYGFASVWPNLVSNVWTVLDHTKMGNMLSLFVLTYLWGQALGGLIAHFTPPKKIIIVSIFLATAFLGAAAADPFNMLLTSVLLGIGSFALGIMEGIALTATTYPLRSQEEIGSAGGVTGTVRLFISTIATAVYNTVINNRLNATVPATVGPAAVAAGLPESSVGQLIAALLAGEPLSSSIVPGMNDRIAAAAELGYRIAYAQTYHTLFLVCIAFTAPGAILCWFTLNADGKKEDFIAGHLHKRAEERELERE